MKKIIFIILILLITASISLAGETYTCKATHPNGYQIAVGLKKKDIPVYIKYSILIFGKGTKVVCAVGGK